MKSVLVVDDSFMIRRYVKSCLAGLDLSVAEAVDGKDGLDKASEQNYDVIITDLNMPRMDGLEMISAVRQIHHYQMTPIVVLTSENSQSMHERTRSAGATALFVKPLRRDSFKRAIELLLNGD